MMVPPDFCHWNLYRALRAIHTHGGASRAADTQGEHMNPLAWIPVAIAVLQVIKETWDD